MRIVTNTLAVLCLLLSQTVSMADLIYQVVPFDLSGGYKIAGGTITTDMPPTTITGFSIEITGPLPYTFSSTAGDPSMVTNSELFSITSTAITVDLDGTSIGGPGFHNSDNSATDCTSCLQSLDFLRDDSSIYYQYNDDDSVPQVEGFLDVSNGVLTVATAVPEPSSFLFLSFVVLAGGSERWWRARRRMSDTFRF